MDLHRVLESLHQLSAIPGQLSVKDALLLLALYEDGVTTYAALQQRLGISGASVSRTIDTLGTKGPRNQPGYGLVQKQRDPQGLRAYLVSLTAKGGFLRK